MTDKIKGMDQMAEWDGESLDDVEAPEFRAHGAAVLKDWSAQDFANIYTRFRPHLERHARRFLRSQHQVDEVVQDAFLYLMVTLPELDSEIGVLRFLKWKVRLLCLDVIRASGRAIINNIDDIAEPASNDAEVGNEMEHIEDAAIVRLALSKLNSRHREVLLASMYEEKSTREIAAQVGLTENATLQLIFRARAAFKKALLGADVDTTGMSVSAILSVAARKAAEEAKKVGAQAMVFVLFMLLAVGAFVNFGSRNTPTVIADGDRNPGTTSAPAPSSSAAVVAQSNKPPVIKSSTSPSAASGTPSPTASISQVVESIKIRPAEVERGVNSRDLAVLINSGASSANLTNVANQGSSSIYTLEAENFIRAKVTLSANSTVSDLAIKFSLGDCDYSSMPREIAQEISSDSFGNRQVTFTGSLAYVIDDNDWLVEDLMLTHNVVKVVLIFDKVSGKYLSSTLQIGSRF
jgi:RNA polymerase sigma factor (sigma-70 family)